MKRRHFVGGLAVAAGLAACGREQQNCEGGTAATGETFEWSCVTSWPPRYPGLGIAVYNLADRVEAAERPHAVLDDAGRVVGSLGRAAVVDVLIGRGGRS